MTLRARLWIGFAAIALLLAVPLGMALQALGNAARAASDLRQSEVEASLLLSRVRVTTQALRQGDLAVSTLLGDTSAYAFMRAQVDSLDRLADTVGALGLDRLRTQLAHSHAELQRYLPEQWRYSQQRDGERADSISEHHIVKAIRDAETLTAELQGEVSVTAGRKASEVERGAQRASMTSVYFLMAAGVGVLGIAAWLTRSIGRPVEELERGMAAVAAGSFGHRLEIAPKRRDELGRLAGSFEQMAAKLGELDRLKAEFVSVASHELKTPVNVILGYVTLLQDGLYGEVAAPQREVLGTIEGQARSLGRLVQHLLDVSRFQAGAGRLELRPLALRPFLADVERSYRVLAVQRELGFSVANAGTLPEVVTWDGDRMTEVLGNLLSNGFKFTSPGGRVDLMITALPATDGSAQERVHMEVRDTGVGIASDELPHIFGKFFQADNQSVATAAGSGLGLAIVKEIVEAHGGTITVDSMVGVGTRFSILIPTHATPRAGDVVRPRAAERAVAALPATAAVGEA